MGGFAFDLGQPVAIAEGETAQVIGRAEFLNKENSYLLLKAAHNGDALELWMTESDIRKAQSHQDRVDKQDQRSADDAAQKEKDAEAGKNKKGE